MKQPLVTRPPYGEGRSRTPLAVAELPQGAPADRGLSLDEGLGPKTFTKPLDDKVEHPKKDESIYRVDNPRDMAKDQGRLEINEDNADASISYNGLGEDVSPKTKYPYRDGIPNAHNASARFVAALWELESAPTRILAALTNVRVAATSDEILAGLDLKFQQRAKQCQATLKRADIKNLRWIFSVDCGNGPKAVKLSAIRKGNVVRFGKLDLELSCSCPAWRWLGPEYHAVQNQYQLSTPRGTASTPDIRDPERDNKVCKHVAAVLGVTRNWQIPATKRRKTT